MTGCDPGELGIYGFRNRSAYDYRSLAVADSGSVLVDRVWDHLSRAGQARDRGRRAADLAAGAGQRRARLLLSDRRHAQGPVHISSLAARRDRVAGRRLPGRRARLSQRGARPHPRGGLRDDRAALHRLPAPARHPPVGLLHDGRDRTRPHAPRLLALPRPRAHPRYEPDHRYRDAIRSYYAYLDEEIGELLERFDEDTTVFVVSDHGARPMQGAICVNEWLAAGGISRARAAALQGAGAVQRGAGRLEQDPCLGRGRLLLPAMPKRRRTRAAGHRHRRPSTSRCSTSSRTASSDCRDPTASQSARASSARASCGASNAGSPRT